MKLAPIYLTLHVHRDQCYGQNLSQFNIHELFANKTPKHPSKLKKKPSIFKPTFQDKSISFDHWTEITFQWYKVHHSSSSYFCLTWTMSMKLSKQKNTMSFSRKLGKNEEKIQLAHILITCIQTISFSSLTFQFRRIFFLFSALMIWCCCQNVCYNIDWRLQMKWVCVFHLYLYSFLAH